MIHILFLPPALSCQQPPQYLKIQYCLNHDQERIECIWNQPDPCNQEKYQLFYTKRSHASPKILKCEPRQTNTCVLIKDSNLLDVTFDFFVSYLPQIPPIEYSFSYKGRQNFKINYPPEQLDALPRPSCKFFLYWSPPNKQIYRFNLLNLEYEIAHRKSLNRYDALFHGEKAANNWTLDTVPTYNTNSIVLSNFSCSHYYDFKIRVRAAESYNSLWSNWSDIKTVYLMNQPVDINEIVIERKKIDTTIKENLDYRKITPKHLYLFALMTITAIVISILVKVYWKRILHRLKEDFWNVPNITIVVALGDNDRGVNFLDSNSPRNSHESTKMPENVMKMKRQFSVNFLNGSKCNCDRMLKIGSESEHLTDSSNGYARSIDTRWDYVCK